MKRIFALILATILLLALPLTVGAAELTVEINKKPVKVYNNLKLELDGRRIQSNHDPFIYNSRTYVPIRLIAEYFDSNVDWLHESRQVMIKKDNNTLLIGVGSNKATKNGQEITLGQDSIPVLATYSDGNSKTMVPLRAVTELLGYEVGWDRSTRTASITNTRPAQAQTQGQQAGSQAYITGVSKTLYQGKEAILVQGVNGNAYTTFSLRDPDRYVVDIDNAKFYHGENMETIDVGIGTVTRARLNDRMVDGRHTGQVRVVLDATDPCRVEIFKTDQGLVIVPDSTSQANKAYNIQKLGANDSGLSQFDANQFEAKNTEREEYNPPPRPVKNPRSKADLVITLDPGHGGKDSGAIGIGGEKEKDINLQASLILESMLKEKGYDVKMTRSGDRFIPVFDRAKLANEWGSDMFISIHANAAKTDEPKGIETFYTPKHLVKLKDTEQYPFAKAVHDGLKSGSGNMENRGIKQGPRLIVLNSTQMPSVLVELGFMTNPEDMEKLNKKDHIYSACQGMAEGIDRYVRNTYGF